MDISADSKLSVNKAAVLWGVSTSTIYKALDSGTLGRSGDGKLVASEMIRVYGPIKVAPEQVQPKPRRAPKATPPSVAATPAKPRSKKTATQPAATTADAAAIIVQPTPQVVKPAAPPAPQLAPVRTISPQLEQQLRLQIAQLEQQLVDAKAREDWLKAQINELWTEKVELQNAKKGVLGRLLG